VVFCIWLIEPVPDQDLPLGKAVQNYFYEQLEYVGADKKSSDSTRVFRIAGSVNSKNGEEVFVDYRHDYRYGLRELQAEYLPELTLARQNTSKKPGRKAKVVHLHNVRSLHYARLLDLVKIAELRDYDLRGSLDQMNDGV